SGQFAGFFMFSGMSGSSSEAFIIEVQCSSWRSITGRCVQPIPRISPIVTSLRQSSPLLFDVPQKRYRGIEPAAQVGAMGAARAILPGRDKRHEYKGTLL